MAAYPQLQVPLVTTLGKVKNDKMCKKKFYLKNAFFIGVKYMKRTYLLQQQRRDRYYVLQ